MQVSEFEGKLNENANVDQWKGAFVKRKSK